MIIGTKVILREKNSADAWDDYAWEIDPELARLDAAPVLSISYSQYLSEYYDSMYRTTLTSHRFSIDTLDGVHIGNCSYYNLDLTGSKTEIGIMIGNRDYWDKGYGTDTLKTLVDYIFNDIGIRRIYLKTLDWNIRAQKCFKKCGFSEYGQLARDGFNFMMMEIYRDQWQEQKTGS